MAKAMANAKVEKDPYRIFETYLPGLTQSSQNANTTAKTWDGWESPYAAPRNLLHTPTLLNRMNTTCTLRVKLSG